MVPYNKSRASVQMSPISFTSHGNSKGNKRHLHAGYKTLDSAWKKMSWVVKCLIWLRWVQTLPSTEMFTQESNKKFTSAEKVKSQTSMSQSPITRRGKLPIYMYILWLEINWSVSYASAKPLAWESRQLFALTTTSAPTLSPGCPAFKHYAVFLVT